LPAAQPGQGLVRRVRHGAPPGRGARRRRRQPTPGGPAMIPAFRNHLPVKIRFGDGVSADLASVLEEEGASRPFVIIDRGLDELIPGVAQALSPLSGAVRFEKDAGEPTVELVESTAQRLTGSGCDAVVAVGGGSSMDTAKAARLVAGQGGPYLRFAHGEAGYEPPSLPLICVPTTAGTG